MAGTDTNEMKSRGVPMGPMGNGGATARPDSFGGFVKRMVSYARRWTPMMLVALVLGSIGAALQIVGPDFLRSMTDEIQKALTVTKPANALPTIGNVDLDAVGKIAWILVFLYSSGALLSWLQSWILANATQKIAAQMREDVSRKIDRLPLRWLDSHSKGDILSRLTNDVDAVGQSLSQSLGSIVSSVTMLIGSVVMMFKNSWQLALVAIGSSLIGLILMMIVMKFSQRFFAQQQIGLGETNGHVEEAYSSHLAVKAYGAESKMESKFNELNDGLYDSAWKSQFFSGLMMPIMNFVGNLGYVAVCVAGAWMVMEDKLTFGVIVAFIMYVRLFTQPLSQLAQAFQNLQRGAAGGERVFSLLDAEEMEDEADKPDFSEALENSGIDDTAAENNGLPVDIKHLRFGYDADKPVIHDLNVHVEPGWKVAIVGPTGAGKSTIVSVLMRFYDQQAGSVNIDGIDTQSVNRDSVHSQFAMVLQDPWTFRGTVLDNIRYVSDASNDEIKRVCSEIGADKFIEQLPRGYDTVLEDDSSLSQGQRQLLTIARAIVKDSPMLILDEATSNVDTRTEQLIQSSMEKASRGRTSFVIAHRLSTIQNADLILVIKDGDIIEQGTHDSLLARDGFYAELYKSQFADCD